MKMKHSNSIIDRSFSIHISGYSKIKFWKLAEYIKKSNEV